MRQHLPERPRRLGRMLNESLIAPLAGGNWLRQKHNLLLTGPTGIGKTRLACIQRHGDPLAMASTPEFGFPCYPRFCESMKQSIPPSFESEYNSHWAQHRRTITKPASSQPLKQSKTSNPSPAAFLHGLGRSLPPRPAEVVPGTVVGSYGAIGISARIHRRPGDCQTNGQ